MGGASRKRVASKFQLSLMVEPSEPPEFGVTTALTKRSSKLEWALSGTNRLIMVAALVHHDMYIIINCSNFVFNQA